MALVPPGSGAGRARASTMASTPASGSGAAVAWGVGWGLRMGGVQPASQTRRLAPRTIQRTDDFGIRRLLNRKSAARSELLTLAGIWGDERTGAGRTAAAVGWVRRLASTEALAWGWFGGQQGGEALVKRSGSQTKARAYARGWQAGCGQDGQQQQCDGQDGRGREASGKAGRGGRAVFCSTVGQGCGGVAHSFLGVAGQWGRRSKDEMGAQVGMAGRGLGTPADPGQDQGKDPDECPVQTGLPASLSSCAVVVHTASKIA